jgi:hypothetical protein
MELGLSGSEERSRTKDVYERSVEEIYEYSDVRKGEGKGTETVT